MILKCFLWFWSCG